MRLTICLAAAVTLCASSMTAQAKTTAKPAAFQLDSTTWTFNQKGIKRRTSIDADGNYIENAVNGGKHLDHGTAVMKDNKACFTSAMTKEGEVCWTVTPVKIGHSINVVSEKGEKLRVKRVAYMKLSMPK